MATAIFIEGVRPIFMNTRGLFQAVSPPPFLNIREESLQKTGAVQVSRHGAPAKASEMHFRQMGPNATRLYSKGSRLPRGLSTA